MKAFITGINGFAGSFLAEELLKNGYLVCGTIQPGTRTSNISKIKKKVILDNIDLLDKKSVFNVIKKRKPDFIFHMAGESSVIKSFKAPLTTYKTNIESALNVLESARIYSSSSRILIVSSAEVYGKIASSGQKVTEKCVISPANPYAASKAVIEMIAKAYYSSYGLKIVIARPVNHIGPRQTPAFFVPTVAKQTAMIIKSKKKPVLKLGNIDIKRDFVDVRDVVNAYILLAKKGKNGEVYNIGSRHQYLLSDIAKRFVLLSKKKIKIKQDKSKMRKTDLRSLKIDYSKIKRLGWTPKKDIRKTTEDILSYWTEKA